MVSKGGHLIQASYIAKELDGEKILMAPRMAEEGFSQFVRIVDCNIMQPLRILYLFIKLPIEIIKMKPDIVISTGAGPGAIAMMIAFCLRIKTVWIDSVANVNTASLSGRLARPFAKIWISQWPRVAAANKGIYIGKIFRIFNSRNSTPV